MWGSWRASRKIGPVRNGNGQRDIRYFERVCLVENAQEA
jgi:hypothetical protein